MDETHSSQELWQRHIQELHSFFSERLFLWHCRFIFILLFISTHNFVFKIPYNKSLIVKKIFFNFHVLILYTNIVWFFIFCSTVHTYCTYMRNISYSKIRKIPLSFISFSRSSSKSSILSEGANSATATAGAEAATDSAA